MNRSGSVWYLSKPPLFFNMAHGQFKMEILHKVLPRRRRRSSVLYHLANFCYVDGKLTLRDHRKEIGTKLKPVNKYYFGFKIGHQGRLLATDLLCTVCYSVFAQRLNRKLKVGMSSWCNSWNAGLQNRSKRVRTPVALLCSLSDKYPWERYEPPLSSTW